MTRPSTLTNDAEEARLDYWREDTLLHVFHDLFHKLHDTDITNRLGRNGELFWYTHQQLVRRYGNLFSFKENDSGKT